MILLQNVMVDEHCVTRFGYNLNPNLAIDPINFSNFLGYLSYL